MQRRLTTEVKSAVGERVRIEGWLYSLRQLGGITFLVVRDGWGIIQAVAESAEEVIPLHEAQAGVESVIAVEGLVVSEAQAPGGIELHELQITVVTAVVEPPPLPLNKRKMAASIGTLLDHAPVTYRHSSQRALFRLGAGVMAGFRKTLVEKNFTEIQTPKIVAAATESGANVFAVDYFGRSAFLAQSPQFYKQIMVGVYERVFEVGPVFRAELHDTTRHINEYVSLDVEFGFIENHFTVMALLRDVLAGILETLTASYEDELRMLRIQVPDVPEQLPYIHFSEAQELIFQRHGVDVRGEPDLSPQDERWLGAWAQEKFGSDFLCVTGYPMRKRPFYTHPDPLRPEFSNSFDLLFRGTELVTGGQRLHRYEEYVAALERAQLPLEPFAYYLEAFKYGMPPEGGFAIGLERLLMQLSGVQNIRQVTAFPRDIHRLTP